MKAIDLIRHSLRMTDDALVTLVSDLREAPLTQPTSAGGNHPLWILGHLAVVEGSLHEALLGEPNPVESWKPLFGMGTEPTTDAAVYPSFDEVLGRFRELRQETLRLLDEFGDEGLDPPPKVIPSGFEEAMQTRGHAFLLLALHQMVHYGQVADVRRVAGLKPLI